MPSCCSKIEDYTESYNPFTYEKTTFNSKAQSTLKFHEGRGCHLAVPIVADICGIKHENATFGNCVKKGVKQGQPLLPYCKALGFNW